jgi:hypothetical protein
MRKRWRAVPFLIALQWFAGSVLASPVLIESGAIQGASTNANFAASGNPNGRGLPTWYAFTRENRKVQYLADRITAGDVPNIESLKIFDAVYASVRHDHK